MTRHAPYLDKFYPEIYRELGNVTRTLRDLYPEVDLPLGLIELVNIRVSQINGCGTCLSIHVPAARKAGVEEWKLDALPAWRMVREYSDQERAALQLAETLTLLPKDRENSRAAVEACEVFAEEQVAALEWAIIMINAFNRVSIASGHPLIRPRTAKKPE
ncbi:carboxymuconolactone decarboxylase family protein [Corynebacterium suedekumii]|uniref:Carboxymuconolactone decarboxylase family protein n=1 Tax=Corynebacterium suedekumii TaxID=3049801 RepID=A0ABY8VS09_9CORY|nr:carboxymuconolactone decarboxylase family protein [Corynebacterium suedekumii]WIM70340.1 carboxymuconolactone decarboxylase family protein [Corynebacterium suedekumii]